MAERAGSLDANIRGHRVNPLGGLGADLPSLRALAFNGGKAFKLGGAQFGPDAEVALIPLPSSSPAHAAVSFERKLEAWRKITPYLVLPSVTARRGRLGPEGIG
jgi:G:T/U-mismatch repair DNA glycosylase